MIKAILVLAGGALGALTRYGVTYFTSKAHSSTFAFGTLYINLIGCLLIGMVFGLNEMRGVNHHFRLFFTTGFLGAMTTFSAYGLETIGYANSGEFSRAIANIVANNIGGLLCVKLGSVLARYMCV
ncbi:MAG: fluoride efflux transporter CrcB [Armatimonadetes bacterium]|nr:fluoride efflux transporter CrcB [Armatimonadota bacterium]